MVENEGLNGQILLVTMGEVSPYNISRVRRLVTKPQYSLLVKTKRAQIKRHRAKQRQRESSWKLGTLLRQNKELLSELDEAQQELNQLVDDTQVN